VSNQSLDWLDQEESQQIQEGELERVGVVPGLAQGSMMPVKLNELRYQHPFVAIEPKPQVTGIAHLDVNGAHSFPLRAGVQIVTIYASVDCVVGMGATPVAPAKGESVEGSDLFVMPAGSWRRFAAWGAGSVDALALAEGYVSVEQYFQAG